MKSLREVRSQSQTSIKIRRSLSSGFKSLRKTRSKRRGEGDEKNNLATINHRVPGARVKQNQIWINFQENLQRQRLIPNGIQRRFDCFRFSLHAIGVRNELDFHVRIAQAIWIHWNEISALSGRRRWWERERKEKHEGWGESFNEFKREERHEVDDEPCGKFSTRLSVWKVESSWFLRWNHSIYQHEAIPDSIENSRRSRQDGLTPA